MNRREYSNANRIRVAAGNVVDRIDATTDDHVAGVLLRSNIDYRPLPDEDWAFCSELIPGSCSAATLCIENSNATGANCYVGTRIDLTGSAATENYINIYADCSCTTIRIGIDDGDCMRTECIRIEEISNYVRSYEYPCTCCRSDRNRVVTNRCQ